MKRGIMEMADGIVITKADGDNIPRAKIAAADLNRALHLFPAREDGWTVPVRLTSAMTGEGLVELASLLEGYTEQMTEKGFFADRRRRQALFWMQQAIDEHLKQDFERTVAARREEIAGRVESGAINPFEAAERLIELYHEELRSRISNSDNA
jgi:LAO/AO transport system kinase